MEPLSVPLERVLGAEVGGVYRDLHREHGVDLRLGTGVEAFEGDGRVRRVRTSDGGAIDCDVVVVGVGVTPRAGLAEAAGLAVGDGILVDAQLRTSAPGVFAAGDVASAEHPFYGRRIRVEHWANAIDQGAAAARSMLGHDVADDRIPYFFSDQYDVGMEYGGHATGLGRGRLPRRPGDDGRGPVPRASAPGTHVIDSTRRRTAGGSARRDGRAATVHPRRLPDRVTARDQARSRC